MNFSHIGEIFADVMIFELLKWIAAGLIIFMISSTVASNCSASRAKVFLGSLIAGE